jgi:phosphoribosyl 1,2-cyclic phosphodiesterase
MQITFWGVRGSIPCPGPKTVRYGGNTSCIEIGFEDLGRTLIIDAGSGIRELGAKIMAKKEKTAPIRTDILLTHTHWDHIIGLPFFAPIYLPDSRLAIYGPATFDDIPLKDVIGWQWSYPHFPIRQEELASHIEYIDLTQGTFDLGNGISLRTKYLNHPAPCLGYRIEYRGRIFCTVYDHEPFRNFFCADPEDATYQDDLYRQGQEAAAEENMRIFEFSRDADLLVTDAQYTGEEYAAGKSGWGHSSCEDAVVLARQAGVRCVALFHHDPTRDDAQLDTLAARHFRPPGAEGPDIFFAREGIQVAL